MGNQQAISPQQQENQSELSPQRLTSDWLNISQPLIKPADLCFDDPPPVANNVLFDKIYGSMLGMAIGDALGAHIEFRPRVYLDENPVKNLQGGGTWGLEAGQWTDDTSMTLCLASSLIVKKGFAAYDQLVRYKWWWRQGYMSSTGRCFDIGHSTKAALDEFVNRQHKFKENLNIGFKELDLLSETSLEEFDTKCSRENIDSNGSLMRLAPVPLFYCQVKSATYAIHYAGESSRITHAGKKAIDACRFYGSLLYAALNGRSKHDLLDKKFYELKLNAGWYGSEPLHPDIVRVAEGSYQTKDRNEITASVMAEQALEAALWAFYNDGDSFHVGVLKCVNLGDDTDTVAAIYGQLAGATYGEKQLPKEWSKLIYAKNFIENISKWLQYEGYQWSQDRGGNQVE